MTPPPRTRKPRKLTRRELAKIAVAISDIVTVTHIIMPGDPLPWEGEHKPLTPKQRVLRKHPGAWMQTNRAAIAESRFIVWRSPKWNATFAGSGPTPARAWASAAEGMKG